MLNNFEKTTVLNIVLIISTVVLSLYTVNWHHQNYLLYHKSNTLQIKNQRIMAFNKQLLIEYSERVSGKEIQESARKKLQMKMPKSIKHISL